MALLAFCGPGAETSSSSRPNLLSKVSLYCFLSTAVGGPPATTLPSFFAASTIFRQSSCASAASALVASSSAMTASKPGVKVLATIPVLNIGFFSSIFEPFTPMVLSRLAGGRQAWRGKVQLEHQKNRTRLGKTEMDQVKGPTLRGCRQAKIDGSQGLRMAI